MVDVQIKQTRTFFYELIKETFTREPDGIYFDKVKTLIDNLKNAEEKIGNLEFIIESFEEVFRNYTIENLKDEYNNLFVDPFNDNMINLNASYYLDGKNFGKTLVNIREFIWKLNLIKNEDVPYTEDSIGFLCDVMVYLIEHGCNQTQMTLFVEYISPFWGKFSSALKENESSNFYACFGELIRFFLDF